MRGLEVAVLVLFITYSLQGLEDKIRSFDDLEDVERDRKRGNKEEKFRYKRKYGINTNLKHYN